MKAASSVISVLLVVLVVNTAGAELVLSLDARQPGASPGTQWEDLSGTNQPFTAASGTGGLPVYNSTAEVYEFGRSAQIHWFECAAEDEDKFDFPANHWQQPANPAGQVTIVAYMNNTGFTDNNCFYGKGQGHLAHQWVTVVREGPTDDATYMDVGFGNGVAERAMSRSQTTDTGLMELWVFHFDGSGYGSNFETYLNGGTSNLASGLGGNNAMEGTYSGNADPLHIGSPLGLTNPDRRFFGEIQFIEVWSGPTAGGMSPADYSEWRGQNLDVIMIPEPATMALLLLGGVGILGRKRK